MHGKSKLFFICIFFGIQYVVLFLILYALRDIVFEDPTNTILAGLFLILYLVISYFFFMSFVTEKLKKESTLNRQALEAQLDAYRRDGKHSAKNLEEVRHLIGANKYNEAFELLNQIANTSINEKDEDESEHLSAQSIQQSEMANNKFETAYERTIIDLIIDKYKVKCHSRNIQFNYRVESKALDNIMSAKDVTSVIENLMDNAIEAIVRHEIQSPDINKWIELQINYKPSENMDRKIMIQVINSGKTLTEDHVNKIFTAGVTSKKGESHGYGLAVVMDIVKNLGGTIQAKTEPETSIEVLVPEI